MSQYTHVFLHHSNDMIPIYLFSRNDTLNILNEWAPYEKVAELTPIVINNSIARLHRNLAIYESNIHSLKQRKNLIGSFNNSIAEKMDLISEIDNEIEDARQESRNIIESIGVLDSWLTLIEEAQEEFPNDKLYIGIECGSQPKI